MSKRIWTAILTIVVGLTLGFAMFLLVEWKPSLGGILAVAGDFLFGFIASFTFWKAKKKRSLSATISVLGVILFLVKAGFDLFEGANVLGPVLIVLLGVFLGYLVCQFRVAPPAR